MEARDALLVRLEDTLRPLVDPDQIAGTAARMLGEYLHVDMHSTQYSRVPD